MASQQPILNPSLPFSGPIFGGLSEGKMVLIQGIVQPFVKSFGVNLRCGSGDIAFHFNPRFNESRPVVVCNTEQSGRWGTEERTYHMPFQPGVYFEAILHVRNHCYQVSVNGQHFLEYKHRLPLYTVQNLEINGDVTVNCISFTNPSDSQFHAAPAYGFQSAATEQAPIPPPLLVRQPPSPSQHFWRAVDQLIHGDPDVLGARGRTREEISNVFAQPVFGAPGPRSKKVKNFPAQHQAPRIVTNPAIPFQVALPRNAYRKITIVGNVPFYANRFHVNLKHSLTGNIALHINSRLKERALVRNTQTHGTWGSEERQVSTLPFLPGQAFQMELLSTKNCYQVSVNGLHVFNYIHRIPANQVDQLEIAGDVTLSSVQY